MTNMVQVFTNKMFGSVRIVEREDGIWFVGKDVAQALGYSNKGKAIQNHVDNEDKLTSQIGNSGQNRQMYLINESGLYSLILSSKLPSAKQFKRWITSEVLPCIRKNGMYMNEETAQEAVEDPALFLAKALHVAKDVIDKQETTIKRQAQEINILTPKATYYDNYMNCEETSTVSETARVLGLTPHQLFTKLTSIGWLVKYQGYHIGDLAPEGIFKEVKTYWQNKVRGRQLRVTTKGFRKIAEMLEGE